jgi:hypothetical protein
MRSIERLRTPAVAAALLLAGASAAEPPDPKQEPPRELVRPAPISVDDIVERIMAFDKNKDGKITKDELPERMQFLIELGDANKDGALDKDEIRKLVTSRAAAPGGFGVGGFQVRAGPGPGPVTFGPGPGPGFGPGPGPSVLEGVVDDLKLPGRKKDQATAAVKAHQENVRRLMDEARADLLEKMKEILSEEELQDFKAALDRPRGGTTFIGPTPPDGPTRPGGLERRTDPRP